MDKREKLLSQPTLTELFLTSASMRHGKTAYITKGPKGQFSVKTTYGELLDRAYKFASALVGGGIQAGDIVAVMSNPALEFAITDIGTTMIGAIVGGIYVTDTSDLVEFKLGHLEAEILVIENAVVKGVEQLDKVLSIPREKLPRLKKIVVVGEFDPAADDRLVAFEEFSDNSDNMEQVSEMLYQLEPSMPAVIIYSSGTQGRPKGAILTHHGLMSNIRQGDTRMNMDENKRYLDFLPPAHVFGYIVRRTVEGLGGTIYVTHRDTLADDLPIVSPHVIAGVPKFFMALADRIRAKVSAMGLDVDKLEDFQKELILRGGGLFDCDLVISAAAAIPDETVLFYKDKLGLRIDQGYGATETSPASAINTEEDWKLGTVGKSFIGV
ncbi:AMP-binding protein, partial [bacterium]